MFLDFAKRDRDIGDQLHRRTAIGDQLQRRAIPRGAGVADEAPVHAVLKLVKHTHTLWRNANLKLKLMEKRDEIEEHKDRIRMLKAVQEYYVSQLTGLQTLQEMSVSLQSRHSLVTQHPETLRTENERLRTTLRKTTHERDACATEVIEVKVRLRAMTARCEQARRDLAAFQAEMAEAERQRKKAASTHTTTHAKLELQETHVSRVHRAKLALEVESATLRAHARSTSGRTRAARPTSCLRVTAARRSI